MQIGCPVILKIMNGGNGERIHFINDKKDLIELKNDYQVNRIAPCILKNILKM